MSKTLLGGTNYHLTRLLAALGSAASLMAAGHASAASSYHVSPAGTGDCSASSTPCTLQSALSQIASLTASTMTGDIIVSLGDGTYRLNSPIVLGASDSGNNGYRVIWQAEANAHPVLSGGTALTGWITVSGMTNTYVASVPTGTKSRQLYVNGRRAQRAWRSSDDFSNWAQTSTGYTVTKSSLIDPVRDKALEFVYPGGAGNATNWTSSRCGVDSIAEDSNDASKFRITMVQPCYSNARLNYPNVGIPSWLENGIGLLSAPGQWYLDSDAGLVYYSPLPGEVLSDSAAVLATSDGLLTANGLSNFTITGLTFRDSTWNGASGNDGIVDMQANLITTGTANPRIMKQVAGAISFSASSAVDFRGNTVMHMGGDGVVFDQSSHNVNVIGNLIYDTSGSAIRIGSGTYSRPNYVYVGPEYMEDAVTVKNNFVHDTAVEFHGGAGIFAGWVKNTTISNNEVFRCRYSCISLGWGWGDTDQVEMVNNHIDGNKVSSAMTSSLNDGGGIYVNGLQGSSPMSSLIGNYVDGLSHEFAAIYLDNGAAYYQVNNNVVTRAPAANAIFLTPGGWGNYNTSSNYNVVEYNYASTSAGSINGDYKSTNTVGQNSFGLTSWPAAANKVMAAAGVDASNWQQGSEPEANIAALGTASSSSYYSDAYVASKAIDSNAGTLWSSTSSDASAWWQLDLGAPSVIRSIELLSRADGNYDPSVRRNFEILASNSSTMTGAITLCSFGAVTFPHAQPILCQGASVPYRYVRVRKTDGRPLTIAELRVYSPSRRNLTDDTSAAISYAGTWTAQSYASQYLGTQHYTTNNNDSFSFTFAGTGVDFISAMGPNRGSFTYTIDGGAAQSGSCYAATAVDQKACLSVHGLIFGSHTLVVTKTGGTYLTLDAFNPVAEIDGEDPSITYNGSWAGQQYAGQYLGTQHYTTTNGDSFSLTFNGTGIDLISTMATNRGSFTYTVDGGGTQNGSCYASTSKDQQACVSISGLGYGSHTLVVTKTGGTYLSVDSLNIHN